MAITRIPRKIKEFEYEGVTFGIRPAITREQVEITKKMSAYERSMKEELKVDKKAGIDKEARQNGDLTLMMEAQKYITQTLCVTPTGEQVFGQLDGHEKIEDVPHDFIARAWQCYSGQLTVSYLAVKIADVLGEEFVRKSAYVDAFLVNLEIARLDKEDSVKAHQARIALDLVKPGSAVSQEDPPTDATMTFYFEEVSYPSQSSSTQTPSES